MTTARNATKPQRSAVTETRGSSQVPICAPNDRADGEDERGDPCHRSVTA